MKQLEVRLTTGANLHVEAPARTQARSGPVLRGYAAVFNSLSHDLGGFRERIRPGAFADSLARREVLGLYAHDHTALLGRTKTGSLRLSEDAHGLLFELHPPKTQLGADIVELVRSGELTSMSFGFVVMPEGDDWRRERGHTIRILTRVELHEISIVPQPAYEATSIAVRAVLDRAIADELATRRRRLDALTA